MARAYQCDRCGGFFTKRFVGCLYDIVTKNCECHKDLCPECNKQLDEWYANKAEFVPKEENNEDVQQNV